VNLGRFVREWRELFRFKALPNESRSIVFYAEDEASWKHLEPIISELVGGFGKKICYITSSAHDPILLNKNDQIETFYIGLGSARTVLFLSLRAGLMAMTMPDLENLNIKRSKYPVHYVYVFHSLVSTHMIYRPRSFDHFDSILCVGPHHVAEIRARESAFGLKPKEIVEAGYGLLDSIMNHNSAEARPEDVTQSQGKRVLIAPSWGPDALLETCGRELVEELLGAGHYVTVRPHQMTMRLNPNLLGELRARFGGTPNFALDLDLASQGTVSASDLMISDWSGAALEYAFGLERPVLYIDVPRKVNNPEYQRIDCVPIEVKLRSEIGAVVAPDRLQEVPYWVEVLCSESSSWRQRIRELRSQWVYNVGNSGAVGASYLAKLSSAGDPCAQGN
jgi:YidC/Oxa1 family membrane protein insertase